MEIRKAILEKKPYKLTHGKGLYVEIRPTGSKMWRYRYRGPGKTADTQGKIVEHVYTIGEYFNDKRPGHISIEEAQRARDEARVLVKQGLHPIDRKKDEKRERQQHAANTFEIVAREWLARERPHWTDDYADQIERALELHVFPTIGAQPVRMISTAQFREIVEKLNKKRKAVTAINLRQWCGAIYRYAILEEKAEFDPTAPLKGYVRRPEVKHKTPLTKDGIAELIEKIEGGSMPKTSIALKLLLYVFVRPTELRRAEWTEFDLDRAVWTIPAEKMKKRDKHLVPLSTQALELLRVLKQISGNRKYLFPNMRRPNDACLSENALNAALRRLGYGGKFSAHGFKATASTELHEMGFDTDIIEFQLAHAERDQTKASYNQAQYWTVRKSMVQQWADMVDAWARGDKVVPIGRAA
jgi:integrase